MTQESPAVQAARARFEDAASRGFPDRNQGQLKYEVDAAIAAQNMAPAALMSEAQLLDAAAAAVTSGDTEAAARLVSDANAAIAGELVVETKTYADGTEATGVAPLPEQSPTAGEEIPPPAEAPAKSKKAK